MNCTDVKAQLMYLLPSEQGDSENPEIRAHLAACTSCLQKWRTGAALRRPAIGTIRTDDGHRFGMPLPKCGHAANTHK